VIYRKVNNGHQKFCYRWLKRWYEDGTLEKLKGRILAVAEEKGMIDWKYGAVDGSFFPLERCGEDVSYGYKGKGILLHSITDAMVCQ